MDGESADTTVQVFRDAHEHAVLEINRVLQQEDGAGFQEALENHLMRLPALQRHHEEQIDQNVSSLKGNLGDIYDIMGELEANLVDLSKTASKDVISFEESEKIQQITQVWKMRSSVEILEAGIKSAVELESFADELLSCEETLQPTEIRTLLEDKQLILSLVPSLPPNHFLHVAADKIWDYLGKLLDEALANHLKDELALYSSPTFNGDQVRTNLTTLANLLAEYFVVVYEAQCIPKFLQSYNVNKIQNLKKRVFSKQPTDSREFLSTFNLYSQIFARETNLLSKVTENIRFLVKTKTSDLVHQFESQVCKHFYVELSGLVAPLLDFQNQEILAKVVEDLKRESVQTVWRDNWKLLSEGLILISSQETQNQATLECIRAPLIKMTQSISNKVLSGITDTFKLVASDTTKITELDEKLQSIHFDKYAVTLRFCLKLYAEVGFGYNHSEWIKLISSFVLSIVKKLDECLRAFERYYFGSESAGGSIKQDPFLSVDRANLYRCLKKGHLLAEIAKDVQPGEGAFHSFSIQKKLINSLLQILINVYGEFLGFKEAVLLILEDLTCESPKALERTPLWTEEVKQVTSWVGYSMQDRLSSQGALSALALQLQSTQSQFIKNLLCLMLKDPRDSLSRCITNPETLAGLQSDIERQSSSLLAKLVQICEDHNTQQQESYFKQRITEWETVLGSSGSSPNTVPIIDNQTTPSPKAGAMYWLELFFTGLLGFLFVQARTTSAPEQTQLLTRLLDVLKASATKNLKYR